MSTENTGSATPPKSKKTRYIVLAVLTLILILFATIFFKLGGGGAMANAVAGCQSDGMRSGNVIKFSRKGGIFFKTYEGELIQKNFSTAEDKWLFSVEDPAVAEEVNKAMLSGKKVVLHYCQTYYKVAWKGQTDYFITKVEYTGE
jgi:hypothetical protein